VFYKAYDLTRDDLYQVQLFDYERWHNVGG